MAVRLKAVLDKTQLLQPHDVEDHTCPVCYEVYLQDSLREFLRKLPCSHVIGAECLLLWASTQTHATSLNRPWCTKLIIHSVDTQNLKTLVYAYAEAAPGRIAAQIERSIRAVDRGLMERRKSFLSLAGFLGLLRLSFDSYIAWLP